jgi:acyl transferase domain-containing protein
MIDIQREPLVIVGLACRFPQDVENPDQFWELLTEGRCTTSEAPIDRFDIESVYRPDNDRVDSVSIC